MHAWWNCWSSRIYKGTLNLFTFESEEDKQGVHVILFALIFNKKNRKQNLRDQAKHRRRLKKGQPKFGQWIRVKG